MPVELKMLVILLLHHCMKGIHTEIPYASKWVQCHCDSSQFMLIHRKNSDSEMNNESSSSARGKHETIMGKDLCVGKDICKEVEKRVAEYGLQWSNWMCDDRWWQ